MTTIQRNYPNLIQEATDQAIFSFSQFGTHWWTCDDKNPRAQDFLIELLQTATSKLNSCIRLYRTWHTKGSFTAEETLEHLKNVESLYQKTIYQNLPRLYQFSRAALDLQPSEELPPLPIFFEDTQHHFQELVKLLFKEIDGATIQKSVESSFYGWNDVVWQTVYPKYLSEVLSTIDSLIHQEGFFSNPNEPVEAALLDLQERLATVKDKKTLLSLEEEFKGLFKTAFSRPPNGKGYGPGLNHRMQHLASLQIPKRCEPFFKPLFEEIFADHLKRIRQLEYRNTVSPFMMQVLKSALETVSKPYRVHVGDFLEPAVRV